MFKLWYKQLINVNSILSTCAKPVYCYSIIVCVFIHRIFSSASETWYRYGSILPRSTLLPTSLCLASYEQCCTWLLKVLHKCCSTMCLEFYWYISTLPWVLCTLRIMCIYQSNPSQLCYNILMWQDNLFTLRCPHSLSKLVSTKVIQHSQLQNWGSYFC